MKKRILFVANSMAGGGAEKILQIIISNINKEKFDISVCSLHEPVSFVGWPDEVKYYSIFKHNFKSTIGRLFHLVGNKIKLLVLGKLPASIFYRCFVRGNYDTEIAFIEGYATRVVGGSTNPKSKKLAWLHTDMYNNHWSTVAFRTQDEERAIYGEFDSIIGVSKSVANSISRLYSEINNTWVFYNPIDERIIQEKAKCKVSMPGSKDAFRLISVGRLVPEKGYDRLIPIIKELSQIGYDIQLYIIGDGSERTRLEQLVHDYALEDKVFLLGFKETPYPYMKMCDAFVCSSRIEGFSTVVAEALILGLPVVATDCAGMKELLGENSEYGLIVNNETESLKEGLKNILNPAILSKYQASARIRGNDFKIEKSIAEFEKFI